MYRELHTHMHKGLHTCTESYTHVQRATHMYRESHMYRELHTCTESYTHVQRATHTCTESYTHVQRVTLMYRELHTCTESYTHVQRVTHMYSTYREYTKSDNLPHSSIFHNMHFQSTCSDRLMRSHCTTAHYLPFSKRAAHLMQR